MRSFLVSKRGETSLKNAVWLLRNLGTSKRPFLAANRGETSLRNTIGLVGNLGTSKRPFFGCKSR